MAYIEGTVLKPVDLSGGVDVCLDLLEIRKLKYKQSKLKYIQPWLFILSDGNSSTDITMVKQKARNAEANNKLTVYPVAIKSGAEINVDYLKGFTTRDRVFELDKDKIKQFFRFIGQSASSDPSAELEIGTISLSDII